MMNITDRKLEITPNKLLKFLRIL